MPCRGPVGLEHDRVNLDRVVRPRRASLHQRVEPRDDDTPDHEIVHPAGRTEVRTHPRGHGDDREPPPYSGHSLRRMVRLGEQPQRRLQGRGTGAGGCNIALHDPLFQDRTFQQARRERTPGHVHDSRGDRLPPAADRLHERCRNMDSREGHDHGRRHSRGPARQLPHGDVGRRPTARPRELGHAGRRDGQHLAYIHHRAGRRHLRLIPPLARALRRRAGSGHNPKVGRGGPCRPRVRGVGCRKRAPDARRGRASHRLGFARIGHIDHPAARNGNRGGLHPCRARGDPRHGFRHHAPLHRFGRHHVVPGRRRNQEGPSDVRGSPARPRRLRPHPSPFLYQQGFRTDLHPRSGTLRAGYVCSRIRPHQRLLRSRPADRERGRVDRTRRRDPPLAGGLHNPCGQDLGLVEAVRRHPAGSRNGWWRG